MIHGAAARGDDRVVVVGASDDVLLVRHVNDNPTRSSVRVAEFGEPRLCVCAREVGIEERCGFALVSRASGGRSGTQRGVASGAAAPG
jgi:hypothetical protein